LYNARPEYKFNPEDRQRLHSERGIVISNHPGILDMPIILKALKDQSGKVRRDTKLFIDATQSQHASDALGEQYVMPAVVNDFDKATAAMETAAEYVEKNNGLFVIFPTGGGDQTGGFKFQKGIVHLLARLKPETMVYTFFIDPVKFKAMVNAKRGVAASLHEVSPFPNLNAFRKLENLQVLEKYTQAGEWQPEMVYGPNRVNYLASAASLTKHYEEMYPEIKNA